MWIEKSIKEGQGPIRAVEASGKKKKRLLRMMEKGWVCNKQSRHTECCGRVIGTLASFSRDIGFGFLDPEAGYCD
jgi:hypothetical protein